MGFPIEVQAVLKQFSDTSASAHDDMELHAGEQGKSHLLLTPGHCLPTAEVLRRKAGLYNNPKFKKTLCTFALNLYLSSNHIELGTIRPLRDSTSWQSFVQGLNFS